MAVSLGTVASFGINGNTAAYRRDRFAVLFEDVPGPPVIAIAQPLRIM